MWVCHALGIKGMRSRVKRKLTRHYSFATIGARLAEALKFARIIAKLLIGWLLRVRLHFNFHFYLASNFMVATARSSASRAVFTQTIDAYLTRHRIGLWRAVVLLVFASLVFGHSKWDDTWVSPLLLTVGMLGVTLATVGRLWCALYISGRKNNELVTSGPYSICRHPLYVCNLLGILGLGAMTESITVMGVLAVAFAIMYPAVIRREDNFLASSFPQYAEYARRTPAFFPRPALYSAEKTWTVHVASFQRNIADSVWFLGLSIVVESFDLLHDVGILRAVVSLV
jgi:protein-S-isoprenylcysteine O-methyltransferase Ste14